MNKSINHITTNNSFSSKLSEKLSFNNQTKKTPKYCFSPTKVGLKKQKTKVDIFFNNGVYTPSTGRGKSTASQQSNLSRSNSSNKMYFNSSSKGAKREKKDTFSAGAGFFPKLAYASEIELIDAVPADAAKMASVVTGDAQIYMPMGDL